MPNFLKKEHITLACFFITFLLGLGLYYNYNNNDVFVYFSTPQLQSEVKNISTNAQLLQIKNKLVYLKVSDDYIKNTYPLLLQTLSKKEKECLEIDNNSIGAHITLSKNKKKMDIDKYLSQPNYTFTTKGFFKINFNNNIQVSENKTNINKKILINETWYCIEVDSPQALELIQSSDPYMFKKIDSSEYKLHMGA